MLDEKDKLAAAFERGVTKQTQDYQFKQGPDGSWFFRSGDWLNLSELLAALPSRAEPVAKSNCPEIPDSWVTNCCNCGRVVDTREEADGGDKFGAEASDGRWLCSAECWDAVFRDEGPFASPLSSSQVTEDDRQFAITAAAQAFCNRGISIACPWEGDLDDEERERFDALVAAITAYNDTLALSPVKGDGQ
jgi:hypothetical protein